MASWAARRHVVPMQFRWLEFEFRLAVLSQSRPLLSPTLLPIYIMSYRNKGKNAKKKKKKKPPNKKTLSSELEKYQIRSRFFLLRIEIWWIENRISSQPYKLHVISNSLKLHWKVSQSHDIGSCEFLNMMNDGMRSEAIIVWH